MANDVYGFRWFNNSDAFYAVIRDHDGKVADQVAGSEPFVTQVNGDWDDYDFVFSLSPASGYFYALTFPSWISAGKYLIDIHLQSGGSAAISDDPIWTRIPVDWNGSEIVSVPPAIPGDEMDLEDDSITSAKIAADAIGASELATDAVDEIAAATQSLLTNYICRVMLNHDDQSDVCGIAAWLELHGEKIDPTTLHANSTITVAVREESAGADLFSVSGDQTDLTNDMWLLSQNSPGFTTRKMYVATATVTIDETDYVGTLVFPTW